MKMINLMKAMFQWISGWFKISQKISNLDKKIEKLRKSSDVASISYLNHIESLDLYEIQFTERLERMRLSLNDAENREKKLSEALDSANEELKTANEILIPGLIAANKVFIDRWDAESAVHAMRMASMEPSKDSEL